MAATPTSPNASPPIPSGPIPSLFPKRGAIRIPSSGTQETRSPASELEMDCSALERKSQGPPISAAANTSRGIHFLPMPRRPPRASAIGSTMRAPTAVRANTSTNGDISFTATRIRRYGIPQITHMAANSKAALRVMTRVYQSLFASGRYPFVTPSLEI